MSGIFSWDHQFDRRVVPLSNALVERRVTAREVPCEGLGDSSSDDYSGFTTAAKLLTQRRVESGIVIAATVFVAM
jgi:hypothetical protein